MMKLGKTYLCRYAHQDDDVPAGWASQPLGNHHGANGYVLWSKEVDANPYKLPEGNVQIGFSGGRTLALKPFFSFYGGKYRIAPRYPMPLQESIIEPFAGSAGFSLRYPSLQVFLYDIDPVICGVWDYLINVSESEIASLPDISHDKIIDDYDLPQEAKWLIGFSLNSGSSQPAKRPSKWARKFNSMTCFWNQKKRERIINQLPYIRHWRIEHKPYWEIENRQAHWFVDPPYNNKAGSHYKHSNVDYQQLADWCKTRHGDVVVCENDGAEWLPFRPLCDAKANYVKGRAKQVTKEVIWVRKDDERQE